MSISTMLPPRVASRANAASYAAADEGSAEKRGLRGARPGPDGANRPGPRKRIGGIAARDHIEHRHRIVDGEREDRNAVQRAARRNDAGARHHAAARLWAARFGERPPA